MSGHAADRNLLFAVFAYQMEFLTRDQLVEGMGAWVLTFGIVGMMGLTDKDRAEVRQQALDWLRADLTAFRQMQGADPAAAVRIRVRLKHWQQDPDLAGVRDAKLQAALSEPERQEWEKLWSDVAALLMP